MFRRSPTRLCPQNTSRRRLKLPAGRRSQKRNCPMPPLMLRYKPQYTAATWHIYSTKRQRNSNICKDMHIAYTMLGKPGSLGGARCPFFGRFGRREAERYLRTQEAYTSHKQVKRCFPRRRHTKRVSQTSNRQISSTCRAPQTATTHC